MRTDYVLVKTECCNPNMDSPCRVILQGVIDGQLQPQLTFLVNPGDAPFYFTTSGLALKDVENEPEFPEVWPKIEAELRKYPLLVATADGFTMHSLYNALSRYSIQYDSLRYVTAKNLCRKGIKSVMYTKDWLSLTILHDWGEEGDMAKDAEIWAKLANYAVADSNYADIEDFCNNNRIIVGHFSPDGFLRCGIKRPPRKRATAQTLEVEVERDENNPFCDMAVVFTGKLETLLRSEAQKLVLKVGGSCPTGVTMKTDYLVVGEQDLRVVGESGLSGKMKKAQEYHEKGSEIEIIGEDEFLQMMGLR